MDVDIVYDLIKEIRTEQQEQGKCLVAIQKDVEINTKDLTEHKEGVIQNRGSIEVLKNIMEEIRKKYDQEIEKLKQPSKIRSWIFNKYVKVITALSLTVGIIFTVLRMFNKV